MTGDDPGPPGLPRRREPTAGTGGHESAGRGGKEFAVPPLAGRHVLLRPILPEDYRFLRVAELTGELGVRWRFRGSTVSPDVWVQRFWQSTLLQYIVCKTDDPTPLGLVVIYQASFQDSHAYLAAERFPGAQSSPLMLFGLALFIDYVFACWDFRKIYLEAAEYNLAQFQSALGRYFELEGRLRGHTWYDGRYWDKVYLALYRETWERESGRVLSAARRPEV